MHVIKHWITPHTAFIETGICHSDHLQVEMYVVWENANLVITGKLNLECIMHHEDSLFTVNYIAFHDAYISGEYGNKRYAHWNLFCEDYFQQKGPTVSMYCLSFMTQVIGANLFSRHFPKLGHMLLLNTKRKSWGAQPPDQLLALVSCERPSSWSNCSIFQVFCWNFCPEAVSELIWGHFHLVVHSSHLGTFWCMPEKPLLIKINRHFLWGLFWVCICQRPFTISCRSFKSPCILEAQPNVLAIA